MRACGIVFTDAERASGNAAMHATARRDEPQEIQDELIEDIEALSRRFDEEYAMLRPGQRVIVDAVLSALEDRRGKCIFIDALAGTGKTLLAIAAGLAKAVRGVEALPVDYYTVFSELEAQLSMEFDFIKEAAAMEEEKRLKAELAKKDAELAAVKRTVRLSSRRSKQ